MPTALDIAANLTGAAVTEAQEKTWFTSMRAALAEMGDPLGRHGAIQNLSLVFSVAANALTCNVKTRAGAVPSATDPVSAAMRSATAASGDFNVRNITAALSLVISSGSTLGHANATAGTIYWYLIDNAGTLELAASTAFYGPKGIATTVAEGGAGAADSERVMYSTTARSNVPFICVARSIDTQTTAGTWTAVPVSIGQAPISEYPTFNVLSRSSNTMLDVLDWAKTVRATGNFTQTLDAAATLGDGWWVRYVNDGTAKQTIDPNGAETIDGATTVDVWPGDSAVIVCNGTNFKTFGLYPGAIPQNAQNSQSAAYTTVLTDANKHILHPTADNNARTFTIDSNANVPYPIGTTITFVNQINTVTIAITSDTLTLAGAGTTGSRTLAASGMATALKISSTGWIISGVNLS